MSRINGLGLVTVFIAAAISTAGACVAVAQVAARAAPLALPPTNAMTNPYRMLPNWPNSSEVSGGAIGILPDGQGGIWLQQRATPGIVHLDRDGKVIGRINVTFASAHGLCQDQDGNLWAADSGPFGGAPGADAKGNQVFKFSPDGKLLLTLGKAGVSKSGPDTFIQPTACQATPDGNIVIADGHWPRPATGPQDGDRLVFYTRDGKFIRDFGHAGRKSGEFIGPHGLAYDSQGRLFVADRGNNRIQIFDKNMNVVDEWRQFGRPSGIWILKDDTLIVADSESNNAIAGGPDAPEGPGNAIRNPGWKNGIRIGSAKDGSLKYFIDGTRPEGLGAEELCNIYAGLANGCEGSPSGGCLQKFVKK
ncbi:MAG: hypothetical protein JWM33_1965 [Caulobacteraceae bacterium]|nr:hypothetical protein [Caulobacteraceae bacterium]